MTNLKTLGLCLICFSLCTFTVAQNKAPLNEPDMNKPRLFTNLPDQITFEVSELKNLLTTANEAGKDITVSSTDKKVAPISGKVISAGSKYDNTIQTLNIRLTSFNNAMLTLSSFTQPDGTVSYTGRIISFTHGDAYELQKKGDQYVLVKKNFNEIVNE
jgi:hypothetical protein